ncbi:MAG: CPBP family intramembrane metalloprotease [Candidatus Omnitrophica bacterium]|nr:CPBP family intramembrane metalloprotease [Candidatus Omnitrophota bacterium]
MLPKLNIEKLRDFISQERAYMLMLVFILLFNAILLMAEKIPEFRQDLIQDKIVRDWRSEQTLEDEVEFSSFNKEQQAWQELSSENIPTFVLLNLLGLVVFFVFSLGLFLDIRILMAKITKRKIFADCKHQRVRWGIWDVGRVVIIFVFLGYLLHIAEALFLPGSWNNGPKAFFPMLNTGIMDLAMLGFIIYFVNVKYKQSLPALGLKLEGWVKNILLAVLSYVAFLPILLLILVLVVLTATLFNYQPPQQSVFKVFLQEQSFFFLFYTTLMVVVLGPVIEEIFFRGFAYSAIKRKWGVPLAMLLTAAIFAGLHGSLLGFFPIMALGFLLVFMYEKTGSLIAPITIHILHNGAMVGLLFLVRHLRRLL